MTSEGNPPFSPRPVAHQFRPHSIRWPHFHFQKHSFEFPLNSFQFPPTTNKDVSTCCTHLIIINHSQWKEVSALSVFIMSNCHKGEGLREIREKLLGSERDIVHSRFQLRFLLSKKVEQNRDSIKRFFRLSNIN